MQRYMRWAVATTALATGALVLSACGSGFGGGGQSGPQKSSDDALTSSDSALTVMIGSSGDAETSAVKDAVAAWSKKSGTDASVVAANDLDQQLAQGFAAGKPADVFYLSPGSLPGYAANGSLLAYGDELDNKDDFYPSLIKNFTFDGKLYCAPKDFSTLQLIINDDDWKKAGLTASDYPQTWDDLAAVAKKLTVGTRAGLVVSAQYERLGAFMVQAGGNLMNADSTKATADSQANIDALTFAKKLLTDKSMAFAADVGAGWGGEAFGKNLGAMTIEGNWITGAMQSDFPDVDYTVVPLPAGPAGRGTLQFTNCWGIAADSPNQKAAVDLVEALTTSDQQLAFSKAFGVMPSVKSAADQWKKANAPLVPFLDAADYAQGVPTVKGITPVITDLDAKLGQLRTQDPKKLLESVQKNLEALQK